MEGSQRTALSPFSHGRRAVGLFLLLLAMIAVGTSCRGFWTPDEPRDAAIGVVMGRPGGDAVIPTLVGRPFLEKPPLYFWGEALATRLFGEKPWAIRLPHLLFAALTLGCMYLLGRDLFSPEAGLLAMAMTATCCLCYQIAIWIDVDAALMPMVAGSLLALVRAVRSGRGRHRCLWYGVWHAFVALAFMSKGIAGWIVPATTLLPYLILRHRLRDLIQWEFLAPIMLEIALIAPWILLVWRSHDGGGMLRSMFWDNTFGRFLVISGNPYSTGGHRHWFGKYVVELPVYLLPWTPLAIAAVWRRGIPGQSSLRIRDEGQALALCAWLPAFIVLSLAATKRGIYLGPDLLGLILLLAHALADQDGRSRLWTGMRLVTAGLIVLSVSVILPGTMIIAALLGGGTAFHVPLLILSAVGWILCQILVWRGFRRALGRGHSGDVVLVGTVALAIALVMEGPALFQLVDLTQDLPRVARMVATQAQTHAIAIYDADETIEGTLAYYGRLTLPELTDVPASRSFIEGHPLGRILVESTPGHGKDLRAQTLARSLDLVVIARTTIPKGRRYDLLGTVGAVH